jgi:thiol-disulfide isomerase/thioredoxin
MRIPTILLLGAAMAMAQAPKVAPRRAPAFSILRPGQPALPLSEYRGKVVALTFISEVCSHCQALTLQLNPIAKEFAPRGVQFLECAINDDAAAGLKEFTMKFQPGFPVGWSTREAMLAFTGVPPMDLHATFVPRMVFLDRLGAIRDDFEPGTDFYQNPAVSVRAELEKLLKK